MYKHLCVLETLKNMHIDLNEWSAYKNLSCPSFL